MNWNELGKVLAEDCQLSRDRLIVVGVSGGPDSLCLLHVLHSLGFPLLAVHVNHQLRPEATLEAEFVARFADSLGIRSRITTVAVKTFAESEKLSLEESARILRYQFLFKVAADTKAQAVAVAHQADDQIETVLMHLLRGAGLSGLKGMPYRGYLPVFSDEIPIVRPLLGIWREQVMAYCREHQIEPCYDASNQDMQYFRNRIRHELIPLLRTYNAQAPQHLWQLAQLAGAEDNLLEALTAQAAQAVILKKEQDFILLSESAFKGLDPAIRRRLIRDLIAFLQQNVRDIGLEAVEKAIGYLLTPKPAGVCQLLEEVWLARFSASEFVLYNTHADFSSLFLLLTVGQEVEVKVPGFTAINSFWSLESKIVTRDQVDFQAGDTVIYLDLDLCPLPLKLTPANTSERFKIPGEPARTIKLGDLFTNKKVFRPVRANWPVLRAGNDLLWAVGLKRARPALVDEGTKKILQIELQKKH